MNDNYPMGCTDRHIGGCGETHECENCGGTGNLGSVCCGAEIVDDVCQKCGKDADPKDCRDCDGEGETYISDEQADEQAYNNAMEDKSDAARGQ